jgi:hypothetical protein
VSPACGQATGGARKTAEASAREVRVMSKEAVIRSATSAAPAHIAKDATVLGPGANGELVELRHGTNGWTCLPDQPDTPGRDPMCLDEQGMAWAQSWMKHEAKPANTAPGIGYMLRGGSDISATDPWAKSTSHYVASPPHWMLLWPVDAEKSGLPTKPKKTGTWIMWAGTPYAHLMINQVP